MKGGNELLREPVSQQVSKDHFRASHVATLPSCLGVAYSKREDRSECVRIEVVIAVSDTFESLMVLLCSSEIDSERAIVIETVVLLVAIVYRKLSLLVYESVEEFVPEDTDAVGVSEWRICEVVQETDQHTY